VRAIAYICPQPSDRTGKAVYEGRITIKAQLAVPAAHEPKLKVLLRYHPCNENACFKAVDDAVEI